MNTSGATILFDGACGFCNRSVAFIAANDPAGRFRFAPAQSETGGRLLARYGLPPQGVGSVILIEGGRVHLRSDATLRIARGLRAPWSLAWAFRFVPRPLRDAAYLVVAKNRTRFGGSAVCARPTPELSARMLG